MFTSEWLQLQVENTKTSADFGTTARDFLGLLQFSISRNSALIAAYQKQSWRVMVNALRVLFRIAALRVSYHDFLANT